MMLFGRTIRICHKYTFKILTIKFIGMSYCFGNYEYDKRNGTLRNIIPYTAHVKQGTQVCQKYRTPQAPAIYGVLCHLP